MLPEKSFDQRARGFEFPRAHQDQALNRKVQLFFFLCARPKAGRAQFWHGQAFRRMKKFRKEKVPEVGKDRPVSGRLDTYEL